MPNPYSAPVMERCEDCRKICLCHDECVCLVYTVQDTDTSLLCHECTDNREGIS